MGYDFYANSACNVPIRPHPNSSRALRRFMHLSVAGTPSCVKIPALFKTYLARLLVTHSTPYIFFSLLHCVSARPIGQTLS